MRYDTLPLLRIEEDIEIYDLLAKNTSDFKTTGFVEYTLTETDVMKPYMISQQFYNSIENTDILLAYNGIENPLADLKVDMVFTIPTADDINTFQLQNKPF